MHHVSQQALAIIPDSRDTLLQVWLPLPSLLGQLCDHGDSSDSLIMDLLKEDEASTEVLLNLTKHFYVLHGEI